MRKNVLETLTKIESRLDLDEVSESGVETPNEAGEGEPSSHAIDEYLLSIADAIMNDLEVNEDAAIDILFGVLDELADEGEIDPVPSDEDPKAEAEWLGLAKAYDLSSRVIEELSAV